MWVPPQWRAGFPAVTVLMLALAALLAWAVGGGHPWIAGFAGGAIVGLVVSIAWTLAALLSMLAVLLVAAAIVIVVLLAAAALATVAVAIVVALAVLAAWYFGYLAPVEARHAAERPAPLRTLGDEGRAGRVLIVHHPGLSGLHTELEESLAAGLTARGWQVNIVPASASTPVDLAPYGLLVLGCPAYNFRPAAPLVNYLARLGPLAGKPVLIVVSGGGLTEPASRRLYALVTAAGGRVLKSVEVWRTRDNRERHGIGDPHAVMRRVGDTLEVGANSLPESVPKG